MTYTPYYTVAAEGHRIGLLTCDTCGCTLTLDADRDVTALHDAWHASVVTMTEDDDE